ncbi:MAG: hypothetical protein BWY41_00110 [Candidatus Atribacteria bacterium ADurb.Bin276]|uniref:Uncharacterized protein n=1 Tax=Candidatus Atribacter allofermentans TaxID=1852833 RepID=A0A1V5T3T7_9BACT|nr:MAG: hypothetical protein BWY41_00110 [Candidatus Atribacteria bacterium ADurb.Bin276]
MSDLGTLVTQVRMNLQATNSLGEDLLYNTEYIKLFISEAYKHYSMRMLNEGEGYFETSVNLAITAGVAEIDISGLLPKFKSVSVLYKRRTMDLYPLKRNEKRYQPIYNNGVGAFDAYLPDYNLRNLNIVLLPTPVVNEPAGPNSGLKLDYNYIPIFPGADEGNEFEFDPVFPIIFEPMIVLYATIAILETKDAMGGVSDIQSFRSRLEIWEQHFSESMARSDSAENVPYQGLSYSFYY